MQTRAALADAALRLAAERGLDQITVEEISEAADVSSRTFFNYFGSKDEAITDAHLAHDAEIRAILATLLPDLPVLAAIRLSLNFAIAQIETDRAQWLLRLRVIEANAGLLATLVASGAAAERETAGVIADRLGLPRDDAYPQLIVAVASAAFRCAMVRWARGDGQQTLSALVDEAFSGVAAGLPNPENATHKPVRPSSKDRA